MVTFDTERFFIAGCQRSGTTLLRLALESHPEVECFDETRSYRALKERTWTASTETRRVGFKIPRWTERTAVLPGSDPLGIDWSEEHVLFLIRDVRDTVASMIDLKLDGTSWLDQWGKPILEAKIRDEPAFSERYRDRIERVRRSGNHPAAIGALYWVFKTESYFDRIDQGWPTTPLVYESVVTDPEPELRRVIERLGLDWSDAVMAHDQKPHQEVFENGLTVGLTDPSRPIDSDSVGRGLRKFSAAIEAEILAIAGDLPDRVNAIRERSSTDDSCRSR